MRDVSVPVNRHHPHCSLLKLMHTVGDGMVA
jgi:hypothetical protein